jgi:hypothetical protein
MKTPRAQFPLHDETELQQIGGQLAKEFLELEKQGYKMPSRIQLLGGSRTRRALLARAMTAKFQQEKCLKIKVRILSGKPLTDSKAFLIDTEYFAKHPIA